MRRRIPEPSSRPSIAGTSDDEDDKTKKKTVLVQGVGPEGCQLPSPSGINMWSTPTQMLFVIAYFLALAFGTVIGRGIFKHCGIPESSKLATGLGFFYVLVGISHFLIPEDFENVVPTKGSWGIWYIPGSRSLHVAWTSVVEILGGMGLLLGSWSINMASGVQLLVTTSIVSDCAFLLFYLTVGMTPANLFMLTHGARLPKDSDPVPMSFHAVRLLLQAWLLAALYRLGEDTFDEVLK